MVRAILLNPLPFPHPEQLVRVYDDLRGSNARDVRMSVPEMYDLEKRSGVFQDLSGLVPALQVSNASQIEALREGRGSGFSAMSRGFRGRPLALELTR